jgi:hypothetical protein
VYLCYDEKKENLELNIVYTTEKCKRKKFKLKNQQRNKGKYSEFERIYVKSFESKKLKRRK